jgi:hypothetical protein
MDENVPAAGIAGGTFDAINLGSFGITIHPFYGLNSRSV